MLTPVTSELRQTLLNYRAQCDVVELFLTHFEAKLPEGLGSISVTDSDPSEFAPVFSVTLERREQHEKDKALTALSEVFGSHGWESKMRAEYGSLVYFDWMKEIPVGGFNFRLKIYGARKMNEPDTRPVHPTEFPLALPEMSQEENDARSDF